MLLGSLMGAVAFQKGLGIVHSMAHPLSPLLDMHHGLANAVCLPYGLQFNIQGCEDRFAMIAHAMNLDEPSGEAVVDFVAKLNKKIGMPARLSEAGVREEHLEPLADLAIDDFAHPNNPKPVTRADFVERYRAAL